MSPITRDPRRLRRALAAAALSVPLSLAVLSPVSPLTPTASAGPDPVADGDGWSVTTAPGGYQVTVELDEPLPIVSDAPTIVVDGETIGLATESADGDTLTVFTSDRSVADAGDVEAGWSSTAEVPGAAATADTEEVLPEATAAEPLPIDPAEPGAFEWTESIYKFGDQAVDLAAIGGIRGELEGKLYLPETGGERPVVLLLHGRHSYCYGPAPSNPLRWPCSANQLSIPSYLGYDGTARALASHGYSVVSISANAINANDNQLASDQGAQARGQLILDTLDLLADANAGRPVEVHDDATGEDVTLAEALVNGTAALAERVDGFVEAPEALDTVVPADLVGRFDLDHVGMMGHSRGGEGVTSAAVLNTMRAAPYGLETILPLAPVDFGRMTVPDVAMNVLLPYCDGDVSNQQGQHMLDDSRYAFGDDSLRSGTWVMGANHNFYNTVWTPGKYLNSVSDDWSGSAARRVEPICGTDPTVAETSIRMTPDEQYDQGTAYMTAWFRLTLGGEEEFLPMFDGTGAVPESLGGEDVRTQATAPSSARSTIASFETTGSLVRPFGGASATLCASLAARTVPQELPACASSAMGSSTVPHWTPASNGGNVPATPVTQLSWTTAAGELRVAVPAAKRDVSGFDHLSVKMAAAESVPTGTDLTLSVVDGSGATWSGMVSEINPQALVRLPTSDTASGLTYLKKLVLQQVMVPTGDIAEAGVDLTDVREVRFTAAIGSDGTEAGAAYLSDLAFESSAVGTPNVGAEPVLDVYAPYVDEGNAAGTYDIAVHLDRPADREVTGYVSLLGSTTSRAGATMEKVTFAPGETCQVVTAALQGDTIPSTANGTVVKASVVNTRDAVMGRSAIVFTTIREDDGVIEPATELPPYGVPGHVCEELAALDEVGAIEPSDPTPLPGDTITLTSDGFRAGESVTFTAEGLEPVTAIADTTGTAVATLLVPDDVTRGTIAVDAVGAGSRHTAEGEFAALDATAVELTWAPEAIEIGEPIELTATVTGAEGVDVSGPVEFFDGETSLGTTEAVDGVATLAVPFGAGTHQVSAVFARTETSQSSTSNVVTFVLSRRQTTLSLSLSAGATTFGTGATATVVVPDGAGGEVSVSVDGEESTLVLGDDDSLEVDLPADLAVGSHPVTARFLGTDQLAPSGEVAATYVVTRAPVTLGMDAPDSVKRGKRFAVTTTVGGAVTDTPVTGDLEIQVAKGGRAFRTVAVAPLAGDSVTVRVPAPKGMQVSFLRVRVVLPAGDTYAAGESPVEVVTLR